MSDCSRMAYEVPEINLKKLARAQGGPPYLLEVDDMFDLLPESVTDMVTTMKWRGHVFVRADGYGVRDGSENKKTN